MTNIRPELRMTAAVIVGVVALAAGLAATGDGIVPFIMLALALVWGWWSWPGRVGNHTPHEAVANLSDPDDVVIYWRPG